MSHPIPSFVQVHRLLEAKVRRRLQIDRAMLDPTFMSLLLMICYAIYLCCNEPCRMSSFDSLCINNVVYDLS